MTKLRYQIRSITGYSESGSRDTSYWVCDTEMNCREVGSFYSGKGKQGSLLLVKALDLAFRLNNGNDRESARLQAGE